MIHSDMKLVRFALSFALGTVLSRILGFLRDAGIAYFFGASHVSDAFFVAFRIPNSFRGLLGEGGFNAAFVPLYTKAVEERREREFLGKVFVFYLLANSSITLAGVLLTDKILLLVAPGLRGTEIFSLALFMARFLFLYLLLVGLNAFFMGVLNAKGRFFVPAVSQGVFNAVFLLTLLLLADRLGHVALIVGVLLGGIFQVLVNVPLSVSLRPSLKFDEEVKTLVRRLIPALGGFGVNQLSIFIDTVLASFLRTGSISYLYYANRLYQLPFGVISVGIANSLLSVLSRRDSRRTRETTDALRLVLIFTLPASAGLILLSSEIVGVVYERGNFSKEDAGTVALSLSLYSLGLVFFSMQKVLSAEFFSRGDTKTPVKISLLTILSGGFFAGVLAFPAGLGIYGLPLGTSLSSLVGFSLALRGVKVSLSWSRLWGSLWRSAVATTLMGLFVLQVKDLVESEAMRVILTVPSAALLYFSLLVALKEELTLGLFKSLVEKLRNP